MNPCRAGRVSGGSCGWSDLLVSLFARPRSATDLEVFQNCIGVAVFLDVENLLPYRFDCPQRARGQATPSLVTEFCMINTQAFLSAWERRSVARCCSNTPSLLPHPVPHPVPRPCRGHDSLDMPPQQLYVKLSHQSFRRMHGPRPFRAPTKRPLCCWRSWLRFSGEENAWKRTWLPAGSWCRSPGAGARRGTPKAACLPWRLLPTTCRDSAAQLPRTPHTGVPSGLRRGLSRDQPLEIPESPTKSPDPILQPRANSVFPRTSRPWHWSLPRRHGTTSAGTTC